MPESMELARIEAQEIAESALFYGETLTQRELRDAEREMLRALGFIPSLTLQSDTQNALIAAFRAEYNRIIGGK